MDKLSNYKQTALVSSFSVAALCATSIYERAQKSSMSDLEILMLYLKILRTNELLFALVFFFFINFIHGHFIERVV
jgi:hypothetical protein